MQSRLIPGSSPLARGLLSPPRSCERRHRIIPARAGFTGEVGVRAVHFRDHPRSRGVYRTFHVKHARMVGSSPLARGLPSTLIPCLLHHRIIPARAGFTIEYSELRPTSQDHPRSRGVYRHAYHVSATRNGSSPLARGLPDQSGRSDDELRIIPARAGFTFDVTALALRHPDHPRSRGVYAESAATNEAGGGVHGSSPLARGLRRHSEDGGENGGIIPARAGFTRREPHRV